MKQFKTILKYELKTYFKNRVFIGVTLFLIAVIAVVMFFPQISAAFSGGGSSEEDMSVMLVASFDDKGSGFVEKAFSAAFENYDVRFVENDIESIKEKIISGEAECAFVIDSPKSYTYYVDDLSMYDGNTYTAEEILLGMNRMSALIAGGFSESEAEAVLSTEIEGSTEKLGKDQRQNFFYTYIMIFALYMVIVLYGQMVATSVATEKSSRAMELLITSAKPTSMMFGKVIASCLAGLIQITVIFGSALLFYNMNESHWGDSRVIKSIFDMPLDLFGYMLLFFVLGFFIYAFMYGAVGSTASRMEDINTSVMPITMTFIIAFIVVMFSMSSGKVDSAVMTVCSFIPFTSPMAMFTRLAMSTVPTYELIISVTILIATTIGVGVLASKIYRVGVLLYGAKPKLGSIIKSVMKA